MKRKNNLINRPVPKNGFVVMNPEDQDLKYYCSTKTTSKKRSTYWTDEAIHSKIYAKEASAKGTVTRLQKNSKQKSLVVIDINTLKIKTFYYDIFLKQIEEEFIFEDTVDKSRSNFLTKKEAYIGELTYLKEYSASLKISIMKNDGAMKDLEKLI